MKDLFKLRRSTGTSATPSTRSTGSNTDIARSKRTLLRILPAEREKALEGRTIEEAIDGACQSILELQCRIHVHRSPPRRRNVVTPRKKE